MIAIFYFLLFLPMQRQKKQAAKIKTRKIPAKRKNKKRRKINRMPVKRSRSKKVMTIVSGAICLVIGLGLFVLSIVAGTSRYWGIGLVIVGTISLIQGFAQSGDD